MSQPTHHCDVLVSNGIVVENATVQNFAYRLMCIQITSGYDWLHGRLSGSAYVVAGRLIDEREFIAAGCGSGDEEHSRIFKEMEKS